MTTSTNRHTPGPWEIDGSGTEIVDSDDCIIATVHPSFLHKEAVTTDYQPGNARLIAAAPTLLASLRAVLPYAMSRAEDLDEARASGNEDPAYPGALEAWQAIETAREALALAAPGLPDNF